MAQHLGSDHRTLRVLALVTAVPAIMVLSAWLTGDASSTGTPSSPPEDYDIIVEPFVTDPTVEALLGWGSLAVTLCCGVIIVAALRASGAPRRDVLIALPWLVLAALAGVSYRVITARVIGANIGGGLFILFLPLAFIGAAVASATIAWLSAEAA